MQTLVLGRHALWPYFSVCVSSTAVGSWPILHFLWVHFCSMFLLAPLVFFGLSDPRASTSLGLVGLRSTGAGLFWPCRKVSHCPCAPFLLEETAMLCFELLAAVSTLRMQAFLLSLLQGVFQTPATHNLYSLLHECSAFGFSAEHPARKEFLPHAALINYSPEAGWLGQDRTRAFPGLRLEAHCNVSLTLSNP